MRRILQVFKVVVGLAVFLSSAAMMYAQDVVISKAAGQPDPIIGTTVVIDVVFDEPVNGFTAGDIDLSGSTTPAALSAAITSGGDGDATYEITITIASGSGTIEVLIVDEAATLVSDGDVDTNPSNTLNISYNLIPQVILSVAPGQDNPTNTSPVTFLAVFNKPVEDFEDGDDIDFSASTTGGTLSATVTEVAPMDDTTYEIEVTGMDDSGAVTISLDAGAGNAIDSGDPSAASNAATVTYDVDPPVITTLTPINGATGQERIINFSAEFDENILAGSGNIEIREDDGDGLVESFPVGGITITGGNTIEFTNTIQLDYLEQYYILIPDGAFTDNLGNQFDGPTVKGDWEFTIKAEPPPTITNFSPTTTCVGETVTINGNDFSTGPTVDIMETDGTTVVEGSITLITGNNTQITFDVPTLPPGDYKLRVTKSSGLNVVSANDLTIIEGPDTGLDINPTAETILLGNNVDITIESPEINTTYELVNVTSGSTVVDTEVVGGAAPPDITLNTGNLNVAQVYTFRVRATITGIGCPVFLEDDILITVEAPPTISNFSPTTTCIGETVTINGNNFSSTPTVDIMEIDGTTLVLDEIDLLTENNTQITFSVPASLSTGNYRLRITTASGFSVVTTTNLTIVARPLTNLPVDPTSQTVILDENVDITISNTQLGIVYRLLDVTSGESQVAMGNGNGGDLVLNSGTLDVEQIYTFRISATNLAGCADLLEAVITLNVVAVSIDPGDDRTVCQGEPTTLGGNPTVTGGQFFNLTWTVDPPGAATIPNNVTNPVVTFSQSATVTLTYNDQSPLELEEVLVVTVNVTTGIEELAFELSPQNNNLVFNLNDPPYDIIGINNSPESGSFLFSGPGVNTAQSKFYPNAANLGNNEIAIDFLNEFGCKSRIDTVFSVVDGDGLILGLDLTGYCKIDQLYDLEVDEDALGGKQYESVHLNNPAFFQYYFYEYTIDRISFRRQDPNNPGQSIEDFFLTDGNPEFSFNPSLADFLEDEYIIRVSVTLVEDIGWSCLDSNNPTTCSGRFTPEPREFDVNSNSFQIFNLPEVSFITIPDEICINGPVSLINVTPAGGSFDSESYLTNAQASQIEFVPSAAQPGLNNPVRYVFEDQNTCVNSVEQNVKVFEVPRFEGNPGLGLAAANGCIGDTIRFTASYSMPDTVSITNSLWEFGDNNNRPVNGPPNNPTLKIYNQVSPGGGYPVSLTVRTGDNCIVNSLPFNLDIGSFPVVDFTWNNVCEEDVIRFVPDVTLPGGENIAGYRWIFGGDPPDTLNTTNDDNQFRNFPPGSVIPVSLTARSTIGCETSIEKSVYKVGQLSVTGTNPYFQDFDGGAGTWISFGPNSSWDLGTPSGTLFNTDASETGTGQAWVTNLNGQYNPEEQSFIHSPCFDLSGLDRPVLGFDFRLMTFQSGLDGAVIQIASGDTPNEEATTWQNVGTVGEGINWFNASGIQGKPGGQEIGQVGWSGTGEDDWERALIALDDYLLGINLEKARFRIAFGSQVTLPDDGNFEGFAVDNFELNQRDRVVLLEHFNNATTTAGIGDMNAINTFIALPKTIEEIIKVQYHISIPEKDPIFRNNQVDPGARSSYYGVSEVPNSFMDGTPNPGQPFTTWATNTFSERTLRSVPARFNQIETVDPGTGDNRLRVEVTFEALSDLPPNTILQVALLEKEIDSQMVPGGTLPNYTFIMKRMLPNAAGTKYTDGILGGTEITESFTWTPDVPFYNSQELALVAFLQDEVTQEVLQAKANLEPSYIPNLEDVTTGADYLREENVSLYPNPATNFTRVQFDQTLKANHQVVVYDQFGKQVWTGVMKAGTHSLEIETGHLSPGVYVITIDNNQEQSVKKKLMVLRK